jgi:hypothetical protein
MVMCTKPDHAAATIGLPLTQSQQQRVNLEKEDMLPYERLDFALTIRI